jgi:hypothetical protein
MLAVNGVGKPCAGEPHARIDGRELETEHTTDHGDGEEQPDGETHGSHGSDAYSRPQPPRQLSTLQPGRGDVRSATACRHRNE